MPQDLVDLSQEMASGGLVASCRICLGELQAGAHCEEGQHVRARRTGPHRPGELSVRLRKDSGPATMIAVIVVYSVINFVIQSVIQPRVVGDAVGLTAMLTFLSLVFWTWVIGPLGALLAVPLTLLTKALLVESDPRTRWALPLIAGTPAPDKQPQSTAAPEPLQEEPSA
ncbi:AI-2E family transporter [Kribbella sp. NPDC026596]|uniref:AI-2E family transporter n=1 Tax=Kribbella sp. NPDC026596 TaxID=3155122 RepID=UPI0034055D66